MIKHLKPRSKLRIFYYRFIDDSNKVFSILYDFLIIIFRLYDDEKLCNLLESTNIIKNKDFNLRKNIIFKNNGEDFYLLNCKFKMFGDSSIVFESECKGKIEFCVFEQSKLST